ncbi:glycosyltransferase family 2 protein [Amnibacterium endophyticum]|uniref:Glycosyltransferase family 2 protein n=1 Tax=Amnibacterium endophyticum TaxID=2109337 RepID=A0ABW4LCP4_9MICO
MRTPLQGRAPGRPATSPSAATPRRIRRQWGSERSRAALPMVPPRPSDRRITLSRLAPVVTVLLWLAYLVTTVLQEFLNHGQLGFRFTMEEISYVLVVTLLTFSALMYLVQRKGALERFRDHHRAPRAELDRHFAGRSGSMTVLVPSYAEETEVIRTTLLSAVLQEYDGLRVVLLVDDPPFPTAPAVRERLDATRALPGRLQALLAEPLTIAREAAARFGLQVDLDGRADAALLRPLADAYSACAAWLHAQADREDVADHVGEFFAERVLRDLARDLQVTVDALEAAMGEGASLPVERAAELHQRLLRVFACELEVFERKRYANLSHEANKAMNLNAYLGLMGGAYRTVQTPEGPALVPAGARRAELLVPDAEYVLTLDADSVLLREYCLRLVHLMEQPGNERVAVVQTPYSSFRGAPTRLERLAAATTDLQHILHQGMTAHGATFWVGANAVIRKRALADIEEVGTERGHVVRRYIQDRTVIEDTESSLDLVSHGWSLVNYPERLSYSATPPDFGALVVQRRRWANGGLLILPKLAREVLRRRRQGESPRPVEVLIRVNYMASIAWASFGLVFLLAYPYDSRLLSPIIVLAALPYFLAQASDLKACGYKRSDVLRIYGFNLILLPVQLAGVLKSLQQAVTGKKIPFARTPKVKNRTATQALYVLSPLLVVGFSVFTAVRDARLEHWPNVAFASFNALLALYAVVAFIGVGHGIADVARGFVGLFLVEREPERRAEETAADASVDWEGLLYHGAPGLPAPVLTGVVKEAQR